MVDQSDYLISCDISASYADMNDMNDYLARGSMFSPMFSILLIPFVIAMFLAINNDVELGLV